MLQGKVFTLSVQVESIAIDGMDSELAEVTLSSPSKRHITIVLDLKKNVSFRWGVSPSGSYWEVTANRNRLLLFALREPPHFFCSKGEKLGPLKVALYKKNPSSFYFEDR